jgi:pilus assembly protein CpaD
MRNFSNVFRACAAAAALLSAACSTPVSEIPASADPSARFPISVEPQMMTLRLPADPPGGDPDITSGGQLERFAQDYLEHGSGSIAVSAPRRFPNAPAQYAARLEALGVPRPRILVGNDDQPGAVDDVRITYIRYRAESAACGDWSTDLGFTLTNATPTNLGCATQHNIAAMVSDPRDLLAPAAAGQADAQRRLTVLDKYRKGVSTPGQKTEEQSGSVSSVAAGSGGSK